MKKIILFISISILSLSSFSQAPTDLFKAKEITWYGIDYSKARLVGTLAFKNPQNIKATFFDSWNSLVLVEPEKYDVKGAFGKVINNNVEMIKNRNQETVQTNELVIDDDYTFDKSEIQGIVNQYNLKETSGIGVVFIVESYNKNKQKGFIYVTVFDIATKKTLIVEKMEGKAQGAGLRNYWAYTTFDVLRQIRNTEYKHWEKMYGG